LGRAAARSCQGSPTTHFGKILSYASGGKEQLLVLQCIKSLGNMLQIVMSIRFQINETFEANAKWASNKAK